MAAPRAKTRVNSVPISTPSAAAMVRFDAPARISMPARVRLTTQYSPAATTSPTATIATR